MEEELKCPSCRQFLRDPVLLHCAHSYCRECALNSQVRCSSLAQNFSSIPSTSRLLPPPVRRISMTSPSQSSSGASDTVSRISVSDTDSVEEKASIPSESDSGVVVCGTSFGENCSSSKNGHAASALYRNCGNVTRPSSFAGPSNSHRDDLYTPRSSLTPLQPCCLTPLQQAHPSALLQQFRIPTILSPSNSGFILVCEACRKPSYYSDENILSNAPTNLVVARIVSKFLQQRCSDGKQTSSVIKTESSADLPAEIQRFAPTICQWCEGQTSSPAKFFCELCGYFYCASCQPVIHPPRGPLKDHRLVCIESSGQACGQNGKHPPDSDICCSKAVDEAGEVQSRPLISSFSPLPSTASSCQASSSTSASPRQSSITIPSPLLGSRHIQPLQFVKSATPELSSSTSSKSHQCETHPEETLTMYCTVCRTTLCCRCLTEARHEQHEVHSLQTAAKEQKASLSQILQSLGAKAKQATEEVGQLKLLQDKIHTNCESLKTELEFQFDALFELLSRRKKALIEYIVAERERRKQQLREQIGKCNSHLNKTTGLVQFCIEILKEPDPLAYLQVGCSIHNRVINQEFLWHQEVCTRPEVEVQLRLDLDGKQLEETINNLEFLQLKAPPTPQFEVSECLAENNSVTVAWQVANTGGAVDGYVLELDSGRGENDFKEVYCGPGSICTVDGLHFNSLYTARVKSFNSTAGESSYSESICLQTASVAWFRCLDSEEPGRPSSKQPELILTNNGLTVTGTSVDYRTILGSASFSQGVHYWEVSVDQYDGHADIVLGVAQAGINKEIMLGKDVNGWSMYIDFERSWFFHNDIHNGRMANRVYGTGCLIGVLMDCDRGSLSFSVDCVPLQMCAFRNMPRGLYYPAFSVNCNAKITVHSGLRVPDVFLDKILKIE